MEMQRKVQKGLKKHRRWRAVQLNALKCLRAKKKSNIHQKKLLRKTLVLWNNEHNR